MFARFATLILAMLLSTGSVAYAKVTAYYDIDMSRILDNSSKEFEGVIRLTADNATSAQLNIMPFADIHLNGEPIRTKAGMINVDLEVNEEKTVKFKRILNENDYITESFFSLDTIVPNLLSDEAAVYDISVTLPIGFIAVMSNDISTQSEADGKIIYNFVFSKPLESVDIIASNDFVVDTKYYNDIAVSTYLFSKDMALAETYLDHTIEYIKEYEKMLGVKYPYNVFNVVESALPSGYAMPTYTSITQMVLSRAFILKTSLPHEILHQWLGVAVRIKDESNWCEALTSYLSDHYFRVRDNTDGGYRKNILYEYMLYIGDNDSNKLSEFKYSDSRNSQIIGYGKGSFLFHMIRSELGNDLFEHSISTFTKKYLFKEASWQDLINIFGEKEYVAPLAKFMLDSTKMIELSEISSSLSIKNSKHILKIYFIRTNGPEILNIGYSIKDGKDEIRKNLKTVLGKNSFLVELPTANSKIALDSDHSVFRQLHPNEIAVNFNAFFASNEIVAVADSFICDEIIKELGVKNIYQSDDATYKILSSNNLFICGKNNPVIQRFLAKNKADTINDISVSSYEVQNNPYRDDKFVLIAENPNNRTMTTLKHYGSFSFVSFKDNKSDVKVSPLSSNGIVLYERKADSGVTPAASQTMQQIADDAVNSKVVFIGESHDNYAHHLNQLEIIKEIYKKNKKIAVGFEMIQSRFQKELNQFINNEITEKEFVKSVEYYKCWGYDYKLYAPIFKFLQENKIPAIALNIDGAITRKISKGGYDSLNNAEKGSLPAEMNLGNRKYYIDLRSIFDSHLTQGKGSKSFTNFFIAQNIWDEIMAESLFRYSMTNPDRQLIVIAGGVHTRKDTGIPARYTRLSGAESYVILQDDEINSETADRVIFTTAFEVAGSPVLGVSLDDSNGKVIVKTIDNESIADKSMLKVDDIIEECNKEAIKDMTDLRYLLSSLTDEDEFVCTVNRKGNRMSIVFELKLQPTVSMSMQDR